MDNKNDIMKLVNDLLTYEGIQISDIPNIDLYMDQVTTFFDEKLGHFKRHEKDKILTKTMINNYTKAKILIPPKKKKYSKQHMLLLIMIYHLKQILSINDIHSLLSSMVDKKVLHKSENLSNNIETIYSKFLEIEKLEFEIAKNTFDKKLDLIKDQASSLENENEEFTAMLLIVIQLIIQANIQKTLAEQIIDQYFGERKKDN